MSSRVVCVEDCQQEGFRWLTLKRITWEDPHGRQRLWESAERTTRRGAVDGVAIVAKILRQGQPPMLPVLKQYRPPIANYCLELPAGLVDEGESAGEAAVRELLEETGYTGRVQDVTHICSSDPGMSSANMQYVEVEVDGDVPENQDVKQQLHDGEFIQVQLVPWLGLLQHIKEEMEKTGCDVDARLLSYAWGLDHAKQLAALAAAAAPATVAAAAAAGATGPHSLGGSPDELAALPAAQPAASGAPGSLDGGSSGGRALQASASAEALLPFGSPVFPSPLRRGNSSQPSPLSLDTRQPTKPAAAGAAAATTEAAEAGSAQHSAADQASSTQPCAAGSGSSTSRLLGSMSGSWLLFAAGCAVGAAVGWLLAQSPGGGGATYKRA